MASNAAVTTFSFQVLARTRDECFELMDQIALGALNLMGGAPWVTVDDDVKRMHMKESIVSDDQGFHYHGTRSCHFAGPLLDVGTMTYHDGMKPQVQVMD